MSTETNLAPTFIANSPLYLTASVTIKSKSRIDKNDARSENGIQNTIVGDTRSPAAFLKDVMV
jgi:hypothetical protein